MKVLAHGLWARGIIVFAIAIVTATAASITCSGGDASTMVEEISATSGRVGRLTIDMSGRADIIAFAGRPSAERFGLSNTIPYDALGYRCSHTPTIGRERLTISAGIYCQTVFFVNRKSRVLSTFFTSDPRYVEAHGVRIGMATAEAERLLGARLRASCGETITLLKRVRLSVAFAGGRPSANGSITGGHVYAFEAHSRADDVGIDECL